MNTEPTTSEKNPLQTRRRWALLGVPALALLAIGAIYLHGGRYVETDNAYLKADKLAVSSEIEGAVVELRVQENQHVEAGDLLFRVDSRPFDIALTRSTAELEEVRTDLAAMQSSYRETQAQIALAQTRLRFAEREERRLADLFAKKFVSRSAYDDAQQAATLAQQSLAPLQRELERIAEQLGGSVDAPAEQHPRYRAALARQAEAELDRERCEVHAPVAGIVNSLPKLGQHLSVGQSALALVASERLWIEANFTETELTHVQPGQSVSIAIDTFPNTHWQGVIDSLSPATGSEFALLPAQNATGNWVKIAQRVPVRIRFDANADLAHLRAGLSAVVEVDTGHRRQLLGMTL